MKRISALGMCVGAALCGDMAIAQPIEALGSSASVQAEAKVLPAMIPANVQLVELERRYVPGPSDTFSVRPWDGSVGSQHPGKLQGVLGFISYTAFDGGSTLYSCLTRDYRDRFTSRDAGCEGQLTMSYSPITGYIANTQLPGTVPLYRCQRGGLQPNNWADHFDSLDVNCENVKNMANDGIIGYIWL